jgi:hypothetical protein
MGWMGEASFKDIKAGDRVTYLQYAGLGRNGPEYKRATAKVNALLTNYISHKSTKNSVD